MRESCLKKNTSTGAKHLRRVPDSVIWLVVLTFPIWLYWFAVALAGQATLVVYLILMPFAYYAILVLVPYIGIPWVLVVILLVIREFWKRRALRRNTRPKKKETGPEPAIVSSSIAKRTDWSELLTVAQEELWYSKALLLDESFVNLG
jgi:hypothetical protein